MKDLQHYSRAASEGSEGRGQLQDTPPAVGGILSIIVPVRVSNLSSLRGFADCYKNLASLPGVEVIVVDSSEAEIYRQIDSTLSDSAVAHIRPMGRAGDGENDKLNNIEYALAHAKGDMIALFDDDLRPTRESVFYIAARLQHVEFVKAMVYFPEPSIFDLIDLAGIFFVNVVSAHRQFWAVLCFRRKAVEMSGFPPKNVLFDEMAFESRFRKKNLSFEYLTDIPIPMVSHRNLRTFLSQRLRYAYENIAYPLRFSLFLAVLPGLCVAAWISKNVLFASVLALSLLVILTCVLGQRRFGKRKVHPRVAIYALGWFWFYPFMSWLALGLWCTGGIRFGPSKIQSVI